MHRCFHQEAVFFFFFFFHVVLLKDLIHAEANRLIRDGEPRTATEHRSCVKIEVDILVDILGSPSLILPMISVAVKEH